MEYWNFKAIVLLSLKVNCNLKGRRDQKHGPQGQN